MDRRLGSHVVREFAAVFDPSALGELEELMYAAALNGSPIREVLLELASAFADARRIGELRREDGRG